MKLGKQPLGSTSAYFLHLSSSLPLCAGGDVVQGVMLGSLFHTGTLAVSLRGWTLAGAQVHVQQPYGSAQPLRP